MSHANCPAPLSTYKTVYWIWLLHASDRIHPIPQRIPSSPLMTILSTYYRFPGQMSDRMLVWSYNKFGVHTLISACVENVMINTITRFNARACISVTGNEQTTESEPIIIFSSLTALGRTLSGWVHSKWTLVGRYESPKCPSNYVIARISVTEIERTTKTKDLSSDSPCVLLLL